jgi:hypothetical protein
MKRLALTFALISLSSLAARADEPMTAEEIAAKHQEGSAKVSTKQDELSADVQQLAIEQTVPKVIQLLTEVKSIMDEATDNLADKNTGGETLAAQTEVIEKIHAAAKEKQKQQGSGQSGSAMMDMMERMMGKQPDGKEPGKGKDGKAAPTGGGGIHGDSDSANDATAGTASGKDEVRRIPKASGAAGRALPEEFKKALDAYNRGAEQKVK